MAKEKFIYNVQTLQYEKVEVSWQERVLKGFGIASAVAVGVMICLPILQRLFPTAKEKSLLNELEQTNAKIRAFNKRIELAEQALGNVQDRDTSVYRMMFRMEPPKNSLAQGGTGGHNRYANLAEYNSADLLVSTEDRLEKLSRMVVEQSKSLDELQHVAQNREKMTASIPSIKPVREDKLHAAIGVMSGFGMRLHPIHHVMKMHKGMDFSADQGTAIQATGDGEVIEAGVKAGYGNCVVISHGYGYETLYGHMYKVGVKTGQTVKKGQFIGLVGSTGQSTGPHCHYEVHLNNKEINPLQFCMDGLTPAEYQALADEAKKANMSRD
jgi:murein DD-endopeptidase MepM/ murein hydrolase activator NlpD